MVPWRGRLARGPDGRHDLMVEHNGPSKVNTGEVAKLATDWSEIDSVEAALAVIADSGITVENISDEVSDGFDLIDDKDVLCGLAMLVIGWRTNSGDFGEFVSVRAICKDGPWQGKRIIFNDGSTGIKTQLHNIESKRTAKGNPTNSLNEWILAPMHADKGLRRSDYTYTDDKGESRPAKTYYFA